MISRIDGTGPVITPQTVRRKTKTGAVGDASFSKHLDESDETEGASAAQETSQLGSVAGVFGIQEVDDALARAARGKKRAKDILDKLDALRMALLDGSMSREDLMELSQTINSRKVEIQDPHLAEILEEIDLRAQVELAKFGSLPA
jgi:hypothetical protein